MRPSRLFPSAVGNGSSSYMTVVIRYVVVVGSDGLLHVRTGSGNYWLMVLAAG